MRPTTSLKLSAAAFTVFWFGSMLLVSGTDDLPTIIILAFCSAIAGLVWYGHMNWAFRRMNLLPRGGINPRAGLQAS